MSGKALPTDKSRDASFSSGTECAKEVSRSRRSVEVDAEKGKEESGTRVRGDGNNSQI